MVAEHHIDLYTYRAKTAAGQVVEGVIEAPGPQAAVRTLRDRDLFVVAIRRARIAGRRALPQRDLAQLARQLGTALGAGIPVAQALDMCAALASTRKLGQAVSAVASEVRKGRSLHAAMEASGVFPRMYLETVRAGEVSGGLPAALLRLAASLDREIALKRKVTSALTYPALVVCVTALVVSVFVTVVVPQVTAMLKSFNAPLPLPTRAVVAAGSFASRALVPGLAALALAASAWWSVKDRPGPARAAESAVRRVPIVGPLASMYAGARTARLLGTLLGAAVPILEALSVTADACGSRLAADALARAREHVSRGGRLHEALEGSSLPPLLVRMIALGEATGDIAGLCTYAADAIEQELDHRTAQLTSLLEPALVAGMGVIVGGILLSMYMPILNLIQTIR